MLGGIDPILLAAVALLLAISLHTIKVATATDVIGSPGYFFDRQVVFVIAGTIGMTVMAMIDPERLRPMPWVLLGVLLGALAVVFVIGTSVQGSNRWIDIGPFNLQPSEIGKVILVLVLASLAAERMHDTEPLRLNLFLAAVAAIPAAVVFLQPDLGTSLVYFALYIGVLMMIMTPWQHFAAIGAGIAAVVLLVIVLLPAVGLPLLKDYQQQRLVSFINPGADASGSGFQLDQAKIAIGSGGASGKGPDGATQAINEFLPEHHTDFIFAVVGEMYGFLGAVAVIGLFGIVIWRTLRISARASTQFEQIVAGAIATMFIFQVSVNIGMNVGFMPVTGVPLPFMSYGGSHTITNLAAIGLLLAIHRRRVGI